MKFLLSLASTLVLFAIVCSASLDRDDTNINSTRAVDCGRHAGNPGRIVGGQIATPQEFPSVVFVIVGGKLCTGTIIRPNVVITASHCIAGTSGEIYVVPGREGNLEHSQKFVAKRVCHTRAPEHKFWPGDFAVIILTLDIPFSEEIQPACMPTSESIERIKKSRTFVVGGGYQDKSGRLPEFLSYLQVRGKSCPKNVRDDKESWLCFTGLKRGGLCGGDSGGPVIADVGGRHTLVGVVSFNFRKDCEAHIGDISVAGNVYSYRETLSSLIDSCLE